MENFKTNKQKQKPKFKQTQLAYVVKFVFAFVFGFCILKTKQNERTPSKRGKQPKQSFKFHPSAARSPLRIAF